MKFYCKNVIETKSVDFEKQHITVKYPNNQEEYLRYSDVANLEIVVKNYTMNTTIYIGNIHIKIELTTGKVIEFNTNGTVNHLFKLIDFQRQVKAFKLVVEGTPSTFDSRLRIYSKTGEKFGFHDQDLVLSIQIAAIVFLIAPFFIINDKYVWIAFIVLSIIASVIGICLDIKRNNIRRRLGL